MEASGRNLVLKTLVITPSGAFSPGLLSVSAIAVGSSMGLMGGLLVALGHTIFEAPYVFLLTKVFGKVKHVIDKYGRILNAITIIFALYFAYGLISMDKVSTTTISVNEALIAGIIFTGANVYFLLWWLSVGLPLIEEASIYGTRGFIIMYSSHVWMDYLWLGLLAAVGDASKLLGPWYITFMKILGIVLVLFALDLGLRTYVGKKLLPW